MLSLLEEFFENAHARKIVAEEFLRLGLRVDVKGKIFADKIEIAPAKIARALGVDRRVVIETAKLIGKNEKLLQVFYRLKPRAFLGNAAREMGFDTIEVRADAKQKGIVAALTGILAADNLSIRQIIADDAELFPDPIVTIVVNGKLKPKTLKKLKELEFAQSVTVK